MVGSYKDCITYKSVSNLPVAKCLASESKIFPKKSVSLKIYIEWLSWNDVYFKI